MNTRKWLAECHAWLDDPTSVQWEECERLTAENAQLQKDYTRIKESATLWHDHYKTKCQEYMDHQAILGAEIVALEAERDALAESDKRLREEVGNLTRGIDHYRQQWSDVCAENQDLRNDIYEHHSADCKKFLLVKKAEREALRADRDSWRQQCSDRVADAARFIDERDALRADAERYRWLRERKRNHASVGRIVDAEGILDYISENTLDRRIDAAIVGEKK